MSYNFVCENVFFSGLLCFAWLYSGQPWFRQLAQKSVAIEYVMVFFPYTVIRPYVPRTSFRESLDNSSKNKTDQNRLFFYYFTQLTRWFYLWAKWFIGLFVNYCIFLGILGHDALSVQQLHGLYLTSAFATTISLFLHTLKFRGYMGARLSFLIYVVSYMWTFFNIWQLRFAFLNTQLVMITAAGMLFNLLLNQNGQAAYQVATAIALTLHKSKIISIV